MTEASGDTIPVRRRTAMPSVSPVSVAKAVVIVCLVLAIAGIAIAAYLAFENLQSRTGVCTITHGCQTVQQSRYGKLFGIPISVPGLGLYLLLGAAAITWLTNFRGLRRWAAFLAFNGALFGFAYSLFLTYIEGWVLEAWCIYCITSASLMFLLFAGWLTVLLITLRPGEPDILDGH
ncbi:MAG: vitamin K epoxide reductase family protein [Tepidiformaceae bacterium]